MNYRRVLLLAELGCDARPAIAAIRSMAPRAEKLLVVVRLPAQRFAWFFGEAPTDLEAAAQDAIEALRADAIGAASSVEVNLTPALNSDALQAVADSAQIDLLVAGPQAFPAVPIVAELRSRLSIAVLWVQQAAAPRGERAPAKLVCLAWGRRTRASIAAFLRDHVDPVEQVTVLGPTGSVPQDISAALGVAGIHVPIEIATLRGESPRQWIDGRMKAGAVDLLVFSRFPMELLLSARWPVPSLFLPPAPTAAAALQGILDAPDVIDDGALLRIRFEYALGIGRRTALPDQQIALVAQGKMVALVTTRDGEAELPVDCHADAYGAFRTEGRDLSDPIAAVEERFTVVRQSAKPLVLFDAELTEQSLLPLRALAEAHELLAVRMRPMRSCRSIREQLHRAALAPRVADASLVLDEGVAIDVSEVLDSVRLARVATRMRGLGFPVAAIVYLGPEKPATDGIPALRPEDIAAAELPFAQPAARSMSLAARLEATTAAPLIPGNLIELELDNVAARGWLLAAIEGSTRRIHLQVYMAADDDIGRQVESALSHAAARGVMVRVLVDSLHGLHGSLGARNPLLERIGSCAGIELRVLRPITGVPSLQDLKQRDHRKLVVVDNALALLGGRNISHEYYTGFDEVALTPRSMWRQVPWLDAGARVRGPAVAVLERSFLETWSQAGGAPFDVAEVAPCGTSAVRVVIHQGLRDARTLEAYLALIDTATAHIYVVNGFPLVLEIQHALLRALRRGVRVRTLFGNLTPTHGGEPFGGPWSSARVAATSLVHSRMDVLIEAGAEGYQFAVSPRPAWAAELGTVRTHVHAKVMSVDGRVCTVGSANMDITAGYWESELLLIADDATIASALESRIDELIAASVRVERDDPAWRESARRRQWMRYWPGVLSI